MEAQGRHFLADELAARLFKLGTLKLFRLGLRPWATCEDVAQDCLERCLAGFAPERGSDFSAYFFHALRNASINVMARPGIPPVEISEELAAPAAPLLNRSVAVQRALLRFGSELDGDERRVFDVAVELLSQLDTRGTADGMPHGFGSTGARRTSLSRDIFLRQWERLRKRLRSSLDGELALSSEDWPEAWR